MGRILEIKRKLNYHGQVENYYDYTEEEIIWNRRPVHSHLDVCRTITGTGYVSSNEKKDQGGDMIASSNI